MVVSGKLLHFSESWLVCTCACACIAVLARTCVEVVCGVSAVGAPLFVVKLRSREDLTTETHLHHASCVGVAGPNL